MSKPTLEFHVPDHGWKQVAPGAWTMPLAEDPDTGARTLLQRYDAGFQDPSTTPLIHDVTEEVYVLSGELTDLRLDQTFTQGMYACRPPGMPHGPYRSRTGCLMFVTTGSRTLSVA
jgi:hypothetical protein